MKDTTTNGSYVAWIGKPQVGECSVQEVLWAAGAVFYARTTQPQAIMHLETSTNIYGVTTNPWNTDLTCGGSSGGEGALIALRGSLLVGFIFFPTHDKDLPLFLFLGTDIMMYHREWVVTLEAPSGIQQVIVVFMASNQLLVELESKEYQTLL